MQSNRFSYSHVTIVGLLFLSMLKCGPIELRKGSWPEAARTPPAVVSDLAFVCIICSMEVKETIVDTSDSGFGFVCPRPPFTSQSSKMSAGLS